MQSLRILRRPHAGCHVQMTRIVLPGMKERRKGAIVNIGSAAATVAPSGPLYCVYAGTKVCHTLLHPSRHRLENSRIILPSLLFPLQCLSQTQQTERSTLEGQEHGWDSACPGVGCAKPHADSRDSLYIVHC